MDKLKVANILFTKTWTEDIIKKAILSWSKPVLISKTLLVIYKVKIASTIH